MTARRWIAVLVSLVLVVAAGAAGAVYLMGRGNDKQTAAAESFAAAWQGGTLASLTYAGSATGQTVATEAQTATASLTSAAKDAPKSVTVSSVTEANGQWQAKLHVTWSLSGSTPWAYDTTLPLRETNGQWRPVFSRSVIHPSLGDQGKLSASRTPGNRGDIVSTDGTTLVTEQPVVVVGIQKSRLKDAAANVAQAAQILGVDGAALLKRVQAASGTAFVSAITLRESAYQAIRSQIQAVPGTVFQRSELSLAPTATFARALLGSVGDATADIVKESGGRVSAGDVTGLSGIQRTYDELLSGTPGVTVTATGTTGSSAAATPSGTSSPAATETNGTAAAAAATETLFTKKAVDGQNLTVTLNQATQVAAEKALEAAQHPAALVAVKVSTGEVLAVANGGPNAAGYNRALLGKYPPGSTFKVASGLSLLEKGVTPSTSIACPATITINGKTFKNAENEVLGSVNFRSDFAHSCNTAFLGSASKVTGQELSDAASSLGYGQSDTLGVPAFTGSVPVTDEEPAHAASMIGQSQVEASPLAVAVASASAAKGARVTPSLVKVPEGTTTASASATADATASGDATATASATSTGTDAEAIPAANAEALRTLMRAVVTEGTGTALKNVPGGAVSGKTGTAEFGNDNPPKTHAWFTGFQGDIAFAVLVEDGGFGAETAAPIAASFLTDLAS